MPWIRGFQPGLQSTGNQAFRLGVLRPTAHHRRRHDFLSNPKAETGGNCGNHFTTHGLKGFVMWR
ncbi:MAG: hypothetical protein U5L09_03555 [Bacteroidales bacterium]|nr:hypothetical protein [Bacteroidales bacterium]